jgi:pyruvate dehydrogenase E1 component alpha subunit
MHLFDAKLGFLGGHGIVGSHIPIAAGAAFAIKYRGGDQVSVCYFGEAAANIGAFHETLNMASLWELPAVFICENNGYGMGTAVARASAVKNLSVRGNAYDMPAETVDGQDVLVVREAMDRAVARARTESKPTLLEIRTYRFVGHSMSDAAHGTYRSKDEVEEYRRRDPIKVLAEQMRAAGSLDDARWSALEAEVKAEVDDAYTFAEESPDPEPAELFTDVYAPEGTGKRQPATGNS